MEQEICCHLLATVTFLTVSITLALFPTRYLISMPEIVLQACLNTVTTLSQRRNKQETANLFLKQKYTETIDIVYRLDS